MIKTLQKSAYKNGYLLLTAAWLYTVSFIFINYWSYTSSPSRVKQRLEHYLALNEEQFEQFTNDKVVLSKILKETIGSRQQVYFDEEYPKLFVYSRNDVGNLLLNFWNTQQVVPQQKDLKRRDGKYYVVYPNGEFEFLKKTSLINGREVVTVGMIPIRWNFFLKNSYLKTEFQAIKQLENRYDLVNQGGNIDIRNGDGRVMFSLKENDKRNRQHYDGLTLSLRVIAIIFLLIFINVLAVDTVKKHGPFKGFLFLSGVVIFIRYLSYHFPIPFSYRQYELFDPSVYASNTLHPSLGDLLINMILLFWFIAFFKMSALPHINEFKRIKGKYSWYVASGLAVLLVALTFISAALIRSLIVDSQISFDVSNFFSLSIYTFISFLILCFIALSFFHTSHIILLLFNKCDDFPWWGKYLVVTLTGLVYLTISLSASFVISNLVVLGWLLLYQLLMEKRNEDLFKPLMKSSFFLVWIMFFAASISTLIIFQNKIVEQQVRQRRAVDLSMLSDPSGQSILSIAIMGLSNLFLSDNYYRLQSPVGNKFIKDSLINENFSGYINKYDTRIYTYDMQMNPLFNDDSISMEVINNIISNRSKKTNIQDFYYYENSDESYSYIYQKVIRDEEGKTLGYFFLHAKPKRYKSDALFPELFKQVKDVTSDLSVNYAYAVYDKGKLITNYGDYNFKTRLPKALWPRQEYALFTKGGVNALWYNAGNNKVVVIIKNGTLLFQAITLFAYLFGSFLFILIIFHVGNLMLRTRFRWRSVKEIFRFNIRTQIQTTILFISIFSFVVIGAATISFYISRFESNNRERLVKAIQIMAKDIQAQVAAHELADDAVKLYDDEASTALQQSISDISEIHSVDVNFYDTNGNLKVSTQPFVYQKQVLSDMMNPEAYYRLHYDNEIQVIQKETIGRFSYLSVYVPIRNEDGQPYAYLNIPYLNSQLELKQEISNFLVTLINLNAFIFVLAGVIAILLTNRITNSFTLIGNKMRDVNLGKVNEEIEWNTNDEIGVLVNEYNKMVHKLEQSALALAKSEREGAWREMARQVAHEIKNPLTPMKLSIQYLQRSVENNAPGMHELSQRVAATLIEQIDKLAKIASDFSQFANIEHVVDEVFNVNDVLGSLMVLYSSNDVINIKWKKLDHPAYIKADKTQVNRLFTNLLQNAIEASAEHQKATITISQNITGDQLLVSISDEGTGISEEMKDKIFIPNFTTKSSGTGLGLAISKGIVEKAHGKIWFTTKQDEGTTFYVTFPLVQEPF